MTKQFWLERYNLFSQIKCYHKNTLSSGRDIIFRCQFHTGAIKDHGLVLDKTELDDACKGLSSTEDQMFQE